MEPPMRNNSTDLTIERNYIARWRHLMPEYEAVKAGRSAHFKRVGDFYAAHGTCSQTFRKYYNRYVREGAETAFVPLKRGPKWRGRRLSPEMAEEILAHRRLGCSRYEIWAALRETRAHAPSLSTIHRLLADKGLNRLTPAMRQTRKSIIKERIGQMGHADLHQLPRDIFMTPPDRTAHVICLMDACSRLAWAEVVQTKKALPVMFKTLKLINTLNASYGVVFEEILTDNGAEFRNVAHPEDHPFEAMLLELGIRHRYTRPYRPQTNGKIERFWRTLDDDVIDGTTFETIDHFAQELFDYLVYYNDFRPHQALGGKTPKAFAQTIAQQPKSPKS